MLVLVVLVAMPVNGALVVRLRKERVREKRFIIILNIVCVDTLLHVSIIIFAVAKLDLSTLHVVSMMQRFTLVAVSLTTAIEVFYVILIILQLTAIRYPLFYRLRVRRSWCHIASGIVWILTSLRALMGALPYESTASFTRITRVIWTASDGFLFVSFVGVLAIYATTFLSLQSQRQSACTSAWRSYRHLSVHLGVFLLCVAPMVGTMIGQYGQGLTFIFDLRSEREVRCTIAYFIRHRHFFFATELSLALWVSRSVWEALLYLRLDKISRHQHQSTISNSHNRKSAPNAVTFANLIDNQEVKVELRPRSNTSTF